MTYRTGNHWGVTIVRETPIDGMTAVDAQLVAVVVNGDQALAERICALLNADERCWHGEHCDGSGPECERDAPLKGGHRDCAAAWHANHGCATEPFDRKRLGIWVGPREAEQAEHRPSIPGGDGLGYGPCTGCGQLWPCAASRTEPPVRIERDATTYGDIAAGIRRYVRPDGTTRLEAREDT